MNYRDERDALRGRIEGLEQDLQDARRLQYDDEAKRARVEQIEARMRQTEENLRAMRAELEALGARPQRKNKFVPVFVVLSVTTFVAGVIGAFLLSKAPLPPPAPLDQVPTNVATGQTIAVPPIEPPSPEEPLKPPAPARQVQASWSGKATSVQGLGFAAGTPCLVNATLESNGDKGRVSHLSVKCKDKVVYDSSDKLEGMSMNGAGMAEEPGKEAGTFTYALSYNDTGARSGPRTQITLDTTHEQGIAWSEVIPVFRVEFRIPTMSDPVKGEALLAAKK